MANVKFIYTKTWKENLGNYRSLILTSKLGKAMEQIVWSAITRYLPQDQAQLMWICDRQVLPDQPDLLLQQHDLLKA